MTQVRIRYTAPAGAARPPRHLVVHAGTAREQRLAFYDAIEIGRYEAGRPEAPGLLLVEDSTVSFRHCILTQHPAAAAPFGT